MKFIWCVTLGIALSCFSGESFGMFGKSTEKVLFEAIANGDDAQAINAIEASSKILMKKYATNLAQTANIKIKKPVEITTAGGGKASVKSLKNTTPLILAVLLGRSAIVKKIIDEYKTNNRPIAYEAQAKTFDKGGVVIATVSAIDVARSLDNEALMKDLVSNDIGSVNDIVHARVWLQQRKLKLEKKLKTLQESLAKLKEKLNQLTQSLQLLKGGLTK